MNEIKVFTNDEFGSVRSTMINGEPYFAGKDVAGILGYNNPRDAVSKHVDAEDKGVAKCDTPGGKQDVTFINESGLYSLILSSKLPSAKKFKRWVTSEVLPSIRKDGGYLAGQEEMSTEELLSRALLYAQQKIIAREKKIEQLTPKAEYFDNLVDSNMLTNFRDTAKELNITQKAFTTWLYEKKYIYKDVKGNIRPYAKHVNAGLFKLKDFVTPTGYSNVQTYLTVSGKNKFRKLIEKAEV